LPCEDKEDANVVVPDANREEGAFPAWFINTFTHLIRTGWSGIVKCWLCCGKRNRYNGCHHSARPLDGSHGQMGRKMILEVYNRLTFTPSGGWQKGSHICEKLWDVEECVHSGTESGPLWPEDRKEKEWEAGNFQSCQTLQTMLGILDFYP
jgi:hypothetical protein